MSEDKFSIVDQEMTISAKYFVEESIPKDKQHDGMYTRRFAYLKAAFMEKRMLKSTLILRIKRG